MYPREYRYPTSVQGLDNMEYANIIKAFPNRSYSRKYRDVSILKFLRTPYPAFYLESVEKGYLDVFKYGLSLAPNLAMEGWMVAGIYADLNIVKFMIDYLQLDKSSVIFQTLFLNILDQPWIFRFLFSRISDKPEFIRNLLSMGFRLKSSKLYVVKKLLKYGVNINVLFEKSYTSGHFSIVKYLLDHGADIHWNRDQFIIAAIQRGDLPLIELAIHYGATIDSNRLILLASQDPDPDVAISILQLLGQYGIIDLVDIQMTIQGVSDKVFDYLLATYPNLMLENQKILLSRAIVNGREYIVSKLLSLGSLDVTSLLKLALSSNRTEIVKQLLLYPHRLTKTDMLYSANSSDTVRLIQDLPGEQLNT